MKVLEAVELYNLISWGSGNTKVRAGGVLSRVAALSSVVRSSGLTKTAFDTRRIDQNTQYNPRRNLQYYIRGPSFIDSQDESKIESFGKLKAVVASIKDEFIGEPEWFDSYASDLDHILEKIFYVADGKNFDFSVSAIQHLEQVLDTRYRLSLEDINKATHDSLRKIIIHKDERLEKSGIYTSGDLSKINKVKDAPAVERKNRIDKMANTMLHLVENMFADEKKLDGLKLDEANANNRLYNKKLQLQACGQEKEICKRVVAEKIEKEKAVLQKLWFDYNSAQKIIRDKKDLETMASNNDDYKKESSKLMEKMSSNIEIFSKNMAVDRPVYESINSERLYAEKAFNEKCSMEKSLMKELSELQTQTAGQISNINASRNVIEGRIRGNLAKMNEIREAERGE